MPTDTATGSVDIEAPYAAVLEVVRDVESQPVWIKEIQEAELLEVYEADGLPASARFKASATVGTDEYTLAYEHHDDGISWTMVTGRLQTGQEGRYTLRELAPDRTAVTYQLTIHHNLPLPGFLRSRIVNGLVQSTLEGLRGHLEQ